MKALFSDLDHFTIWKCVVITALVLVGFWSHKKHNAQTNGTKARSKFGKVVQVGQGEWDRNGLRSEGTGHLFCHQIQNV